MHELIVHQQIPKTAATSVVELLKDSYPRDTIVVINIVNDRRSTGDVLLVTDNDHHTGDIWARLKQLPESTSALSIMAPWGFQNALSRPYLAFAFVRQPISRLSSYWNFACKAARGGRASFAPFRDADFNLDVALTRMISLSFFNEQTRMISGSNRIWLCKDDFRRAQEVISEDFGFVGLVESFDASIKFLRDMLGICGAGEYRLNTANGFYDFPLSLRQIRLLENLNEWDIKLYEWITMHMQEIAVRARARRQQAA